MIESVRLTDADSVQSEYFKHQLDVYFTNSLFCANIAMMTHKIYRKQNYRNIFLDVPNDNNEVVGVQLRDRVVYAKWLGTVSRSEAKRLGKPVKLMLSRVDGYDLKPGKEFGHGVWTDRGVYVIADIAIITDTE